jgi:pyruvate carboxylase
MLLQACVKHARDDSDFYLAYYTAKFLKRKDNRYYFIDINLVAFVGKNSVAVYKTGVAIAQKNVLRQAFFSDGFILARSALSLNGEIEK